MIARRFLYLVICSIFISCASEAQPGRDLEYKGEHQSYHFSDSTLYPTDPGAFVQYVMDSIPPEDRVYITFDTISGFLVNGHKVSVGYKVESEK